MSDGSPNPFKSPSPELQNVSPGQPHGGPGVPSLVYQVLVLSILQIVQGSFEILAALIASGYGIFFVVMAFVIPTQANTTAEDETAAVMMGVFSVVFIAIGLMLIIVGILRIWAGIAGIKFRRRKLGIWSIIIGALSCMTFYCAITSIGLLVYGLIVYLDPNVKRAFDLAEKGWTADQIRDPANWS